MSTPTSQPRTFGVVVKYKTETGWSKEYTFAHFADVKPDSLVVVKNKDFCTVVRVKACIPNYKFDPEITYKPILQVLEASYSDL